MNVLRCIDSEHYSTAAGKRYLVATTWSGIDFTIDGVPLRTYVVDEEGRQLARGDLTLFDLELPDPVEVLLGRADWDPDAATSDRSPILLCGCGDPYCGALMAKVEVSAETVSWTDWAWDRFYEAATPIENIPDFTFDRQQYASELARARRVGQPEPIATFRVRETFTFVDFMFPSREKKPRRIVKNRLAELNADAVKPSLGEAEGDYGDFLSELAAAQALVTGWHSKHAPRTDADLAATSEALTWLLKSPFVNRLPSVTIEAIEWFLADLQG